VRNETKPYSSPKKLVGSKRDLGLVAASSLSWDVVTGRPEKQGA